MYLKYISLFLVVLAPLAKSAAQSKKINKVRAYNHSTIPAPEGMTYVPGGSILMKYNNLDGDTAGYKKVSLSPFFIDKTEVTNKQYREFVNWVIDSLAIANYIKDEDYFLSSGDTGSKRIDVKKINPKKPLWQKSDKDIQTALQPMFDHGEIRRDMVNYTYTHLKRNSENQTGSYVTETINVYPDNRVWATDFPNSQTDMMVQAYFTNKAFDDYPVVGVTWEQARAYAVWRSNMQRNSGKKGKGMFGYELPFALPSEAQWVYAAKGEVSYEAVDSFKAPRDKNDRLVANFKQEEGEYTQDGSSYTVHVKSYAPNQLGLYNMLGNVSEWVLDAFNESAWAFVHDQNPVLLYDAGPSEPEVMKRKVVRGGSWKDNAQSLSPSTRSFEVQNVPHSYTGFRCVMPAPEILTKKVETRRK